MVYKLPEGKVPLGDISVGGTVILKYVVDEV
jgi:hypothetical protein